MAIKRITKHPVLEILNKNEVAFTWNGDTLTGYEGEMLSSALFANNIHIFGRHYKDNSPQGMFCANGQCSQCMVIANGVPIKSCMTSLNKGMVLQSIEGLPRLPDVQTIPSVSDIPIIDVDVLIIGAGPAGLSAAIELGKLGVHTLIVDDKDRPGGKLVLQTHKFFGSVKDSYAGTRGFEIADILTKRLKQLVHVKIWLNTTVVGVFSAFRHKISQQIRHFFQEIFVKRYIFLFGEYGCVKDVAFDEILKEMCSKGQVRH